MIKLFQMGYSVPWLLTGDGNMRSSDYVVESATTVNYKGFVPVLGTTSAGPDGFYDEHNVPNIKQAEEFIPRPEGLKDPMAYALLISSINGDSMMPYFKPQDTVIASPMATVVENDMVIAKLKDGRVMFKLIKYKNGNVELHSANPDYETIVIPSTDLIFAHKVVGVIGK